jgi:hypothetical protein
MPNADIADHRTHVAGAKNVPYQTVSLMHVERIALRGNDASGVLPPMLEHQQAVVQQLVDGSLRNETKNSTHNVFQKIT